MGRLLSNNRREIASKRLKFLFYEVVPIFLIIFVFLILEWMLLPFIVNQSSVLFGMLFYLIRALMIFLVIILFLFVANRFKTKNSQSTKKEFAPHTGYLKLFKMTRKNYIYQLLYSLLLFFLILIPLEFVFLIGLPETMLFRAFSLAFENNDNFTLFLFLSIGIQLSISFSEETVFRGLIAKRGSEHFNKVSAAMISTLYFSFVEVFLNPLFFTVSPYFSALWFIKSFIIGFIFSLTLIRRKWLLPLIIAKTFNSILSSVIVWDFLRGGNLVLPLMIIYSSLLVISLIFLILQFSRVKESLQIGINMIKSYLRNDIKLEESSGDRIFRILFDIFLALLLLLFGMMITV